MKIEVILSRDSETLSLGKFNSANMTQHLLYADGVYRGYLNKDDMFVMYGNTSVKWENVLFVPVEE